MLLLLLDGSHKNLLWYHYIVQLIEHFTLVTLHHFEKSVNFQICAVLYPGDATEEGKLLRLKQQFFLCSASLQVCSCSLCPKLCI